jgi:2-polyprenyl-3-methyl-5-hydroxy-6-metoxy-1,4-benzoquinol methylase
MHQSSLDKMSKFRDQYLQDRESDSLQILDLGSQDIGGSYRSIFKNPNWQYCGVDVTPGSNVDIVLHNPYAWKEIPSSSVDVLVSGQAFEHIEFFWLTMQEIARVLKPGGLCCIIAPSGGYEHRYPVDCWRFYPDGFASLARYAKLEALEVTTQWEDLNYEDGSDIWKDSILVAQKPLVSPAAHDSTPYITSYSFPGEEISEQDLDDNSGHRKMLELVGKDKKVIDFGCATGFLARLLKDRHCKVVGIEIDPEAATTAEKYCEKVHVVDLDRISPVELLTGQKFDVAIFGDVLEHLRDPWRILEETRELLTPEGYIVASIPNVAHGAIRLALLQGQFEYSTMGILDNTHLKFFTRKTAQELFERSGYFVDVIDRTREPIFSKSRLIPQVDRSEFGEQLIHQLEQEEDSTTIQFILRAFPLSLEGKYSALKQHYVQSKQQRDELQQQRDELQHQVSHLYSKFQVAQSELERSRLELQHSQKHLEESQSQLQHLKMELEDTRNNVEQAQATIAAMETSKFWQLRTLWFQFKKKLGLKTI